MSEPAHRRRLRAPRRGVGSSRGALGTYAGGACDERTLRRATSRPGARYRLRPRVLVDVDGTTARRRRCSARTSRCRVLVAPTAFQRMAHPDGEPGTARAAAAAGTIMCLSTMATATPAEVAAAAPDAPRWFQLYVLPRPRRHDARSSSRRSSRATARSCSRSTRRGSVAASATCAPSSACPRTYSCRAWPPRRRLGRERRRSSARRGSIRRSPGTTSSELRRDSPLPARSSRGSRPARTPRSPCEHGADAIVVSNHGGPPARRRRADVRAAARGRSRRVDGRIEVLRRRRHPPRQPTWSRRSRSAPARCSSAVRRPLGSRLRRRGRGAPRARAAPRRDRARARASVAARRRRRSPRRTSVESAARERRGSHPQRRRRPAQQAGSRRS